MTGLMEIELSNGAAEYLVDHETELQLFSLDPLTADLQAVVDQGVRNFETCIYLASLGDFRPTHYYYPVKGARDCTFSEYNFNKLHLVPLVECADKEDRQICALAQGFKFMGALKDRLPESDFAVDMSMSCDHENQDLDLRSCVFRLHQSRSEEHQWPQPGDIDGQSYFESFVLVVRFSADREIEPVDVLSAVMTEAKRRTKF